MPTISTSYKGNMLFESEMRGHRLAIDVPAKMGGEDRGPTPPELFIASLGSCVAALVADYCERKDLDASGMSVDVSFGTDVNPTRLVDLRVRIHLPHATWDEKQEVILERVAKHCPVHETLRTLQEVSFDIVGEPVPA